MEKTNYASLEEMPEILTAEMISAYLGIGYNKALSLIKYGGITYIRIGNVYRVPKRNFEQWLLQAESRIISLA